VLHVRFQVLTAACMKIAALWDIAPCSFVEVDRRFRGTYLLPSSGRSISTRLTALYAKELSFFGYLQINASECYFNYRRFRKLNTS
jgi:hypothetical protein